MKVIIYNQQERFDRFNAIVSNLSSMKSILQNNMVLDHEAMAEFFEVFDSRMKDLSVWRTDLRDHLWDKLVNDGIGEKVEQSMSANYGNVPEELLLEYPKLFAK